MGLRIATNVPSINAQRQLKQNSGAIETSMQRLSSGQRINKSSDDVAGLAISEKMRGQIRGLAQAQRNAQDGVSFMQVADGALGETSNILIRVRELATQAASDTVGETERKFVNVEVKQLLTEMNRISDTTEYSGTKLLNGSAGVLDFQVGTGGGDNNVISFNAGEANASASALGLSGLGVETKADARSTLDNIDQALNKVGTMRASFGAIQSRMGATINNLGVYEENLTAANSRIRDTDFAKEAADLAKNSIVQQASVATLAQANQNTALALKLL
ncbi:MAG: flagellin [Bdellovibrionota bacterium]